MFVACEEETGNESDMRAALSRNSYIRPIGCVDDARSMRGRYHSAAHRNAPAATLLRSDGGVNVQKVIDQVIFDST